MPVTVACVVMTGESRERDAAVTIAGGFSGAAVPAHSASATSSYTATRVLCGCCVRAERSASQARAAAAGAAAGAAMQLR